MRKQRLGAGQGGIWGPSSQSAAGLGFHLAQSGSKAGWIFGSYQPEAVNGKVLHSSAAGRGTCERSSGPQVLLPGDTGPSPLGCPSQRTGPHLSCSLPSPGAWPMRGAQQESAEGMSDWGWPDQRAQDALKT